MVREPCPAMSFVLGCLYTANATNNDQKYKSVELDNQLGEPPLLHAPSDRKLKTENRKQKTKKRK